jgi:single-strand DNA-binding protein
MLPTIEIMGNISKIQTKILPNGKQLTSFQIECSEKNKNGEWNNLYIKGECWEKSAEFVSKYFKDGDVAIVTGKLFTNVYDKKDGTKAYENKFLFPSVSFPPKAKDSQSNNNQGQQQQQNNYNPPQQQYNNQPTIDSDMDESIPF